MFRFSSNFSKSSLLWVIFIIKKAPLFCGNSKSFKGIYFFFKNRKLKFFKKQVSFLSFFLRTIFFFNCQMANGFCLWAMSKVVQAFIQVAMIFLCFFRKNLKFCSNSHVIFRSLTFNFCSVHFFVKRKENLLIEQQKL